MLNALKTDLSELLGLSKDALHVHLGLVVMLAAMVVFRKSPASFVPWVAVLVIELLNEALDVFHWHEGHLDFSTWGGVKDVLNTMLWPTVILMLARHPSILRGTR